MTTHPHGQRRVAVALATLLMCSACLPYVLGSTAQTVAPHEWRKTASFWFMPNGVTLNESASEGHTLSGGDVEARVGLNDHADFGIRVPSGNGIVLTYRQRVAGAAHPDSAAFAWQLGGGPVNFAEHALFEAGLLGSGRKHGNVTWYGAARILQVVPLSTGAVHDDPSIGMTVGARIDIGGGGVLPELSVYHDRSALGLRRSTFIIVPAVSLYGPTLRDLFDIVRMAGRISR